MDELTVVREMVVRRPVAEVFDAWLDPAKVVLWISADATETPTMESDPKVGGAYRIVVPNPGGRTIISGEYESIIAEELLVFSWRCSAFPGEDTRVTVRFAAEGGDTRVRLLHENFGNTETRQVHSVGWDNCLQLIAQLLSTTA